jgi:tetratricopeptide (TPR) repeat protein
MPRIFTLRRCVPLLLLLMCGPLLAGEAEQLLERGVAKADAGDPAGAISDFDRAIALSPTCAEAYFNRGSVHYSQGRLDQAIADLDKAIQINPTFAPAYDNRGCARKDKGDRSGAIRDFEEALKLDPRDTVARVNRARACASERPQQALEDFNAALAITPDDGALYFERGALHRDRQDYEAACKDFLLAIRNGFKDPGAYAGAGSMQSYLHDDAAALATLNDGLAASPDSPELYFLRAKARLAVGKVDDRMVDDYTNKDDALPAPALQCVQQAIDDYTRAIQLQPRYADACLERADLLSLKHDWKRAIADYSKVIALDPKSIPAYGGRALAREKTGETHGAAVDRMLESKLRADIMQEAQEAVRKANESLQQVRETEKQFKQFNDDLRRAQEQAQKVMDDMREREKWDAIMKNASKAFPQKLTEEQLRKQDLETHTPPKLPDSPEPSGK